MPIPRPSALPGTKRTVSGTIFDESASPSKKHGFVPIYIGPLNPSNMDKF